MRPALGGVYLIGDVATGEGRLQRRPYGLILLEWVQTRGFNPLPQ
ncbi:hypothetical protein [Candidatus Chlorohelix sp.]